MLFLKRLINAIKKQGLSMKRFVFFLSMLLLSSVPAAAGTFDFVVATTNANETFAFIVDGAQNFTIDWGDGKTNTVLEVALQSHEYATAGTYTNRVCGTATRIAFGGTGTTPLLLRDIVSHLSDGVTGIDSAVEMFRGAKNITEFTEANWFDAASTNVSTMISMFNGASAFNQDIVGWDVSKVTTMANMFWGASAFNQDIGEWDVSNVTQMTYMFYSALAFNQDIGGWDVSKVRSMSSMFLSAPAFNQNISGWDVTEVANMGHMFRNTSAFNQDIGRWNVSKVTTMENMFDNASVFNQDIGNWDVSKVVSMERMFFDALVFNQDISNWDVSKVATMQHMFYHARKFNQDISNWDVSQVTHMGNMFNGAHAFNQDIGGWDVSKVANMYRMFCYAYAFKRDISRWNVSEVKSFGQFALDIWFPTDAYNQLLIRWSRLPLQLHLTFDGGKSKYDDGLPAECRERLETNFNWTITDGNSTGNPYPMPATVFCIR